MQRTIWLVLLLLVLASKIGAQQVNLEFEHLSIEQGLSQSTVRFMLQDHYGFIWISTDDGLNRYDGYTFKIFRHDSQNPNSISDNLITAMAEDSDGILWLGTADHGLSSYDPVSQHFTHYTYNSNDPTSISNDHVVCVYVDRANTLWVGTTNGFNKYDRQNRRFIRYLHSADIAKIPDSNKISELYQDSTGIFWIGTAEGLLKFDPVREQFTALLNDPNNPHSLSHNHICSLLEGHDHALWIGTSNGLNRYDRTTNQFTRFYPKFVKPQPIGNSSINSLAEDLQGRLWIGTPNGLNCLDRERTNLTLYQSDENNPKSISNNYIRSMMVDRAGVVWIGTIDNGLNCYDEKKSRFPKYTNIPGQPPQLSNNGVTAFLEDTNGALWVGTVDGLNRYDKKSGWQIFRTDSKNKFSLKSNIIRALYQDSNGKVWVGTSNGLNCFDIKLDAFVAPPQVLFEKFVNENVLSVFEDSLGLLWICSLTSGLYQYNPQTNSLHNYQTESEPLSIYSKRVTSAIEDRAKNIWIGTLGSGLYMYERATQRFINYQTTTNSPSLTSNRIVSFCLDHNGIIWIGCPNGLNRLDPVQHTFTSFTEKDGLPNNNIYGIVADQDGYLWLSTNLGISRFDPSTGKVKNFDVSDGLQSNEFNNGSFYQSRRGEIFFGGIHGYNRFFPQQIKDNPLLPPLAITSFKATDSMEKQSLKRDFLPDQALLPLPYQDNFLTIDFAALNFTQTERNQYAYKLEGVDENWVYAGRQHSARYTALPPGDYQFEVRGTNNDGIWSPNIVTINIHIIPPFWRTWWAYLIYLSTLITLLYGGHHYQLRIVEKRNLLLEAKVNERTTEVSRKKEELEQKNRQLEAKNLQLLQSNQRADRIFSALAEALPGTILDEKYQLGDKIGAGGFGAVYRAIHLLIKRDVAVKVFRPAQGNDSAEALERFQQEAVSACRVNHPNAVAVLDSGISDEGIAYLVMELLQGHTLTSELRKYGSLSLERCGQIVLPICSVLAKAHAAGIVHRDIKPDNIFLHQGNESEILKVVDFGIAKLIDASMGEVKDLTGTGGLIGTPSYIAPERFAQKSYDGRSDIYSLGIMIYEMICGRVPFLANEGFAGIMMAHMSQTPPSLSKFQPDILPELAELVMSTLAKDPAERPTAQELAQQFASICGIDASQQSLSDTGKVEIMIEDADTMVINRKSLKISIKSEKKDPATDEIEPSQQITLIDPSHER